MSVYADLKNIAKDNQSVIGVGTALGVALYTLVAVRPKRVKDLSYTPNGDLLVKYNRGECRVIGKPRV